MVVVQLSPGQAKASRLAHFSVRSSVLTPYDLRPEGRGNERGGPRVGTGRRSPMERVA